MLKTKFYALCVLYYALYPFAFLMYFATGRNFGNYAIDFVSLLKPKQQHRLLSLCGLVESADFTSNVYKKANNFTGMHLPAQRPTLANGSISADGGAQVAKYFNRLACALDWYLWLDTRSSFLSIIDKIDTSISPAHVLAVASLFKIQYGVSATTSGYDALANSDKVFKYKYYHVPASILLGCVGVYFLVRSTKKRRVKRKTNRPFKSKVYRLKPRTQMLGARRVNV